MALSWLLASLLLVVAHLDLHCARVGALGSALGRDEGLHVGYIDPADLLHFDISKLAQTTIVVAAIRVKGNNGNSAMHYKYEDEVNVEVEGDDDLSFTAPFVLFTKFVSLRNCTIKQLDLQATYFVGGLEIVGCKVLGDVFWQSGGHNKRPIRIIDSEFAGFLDVEDCWFVNEIVLRRVVLRKGTNLQGNLATPVEVLFETPLVIDDVDGQLDVQTYK